MVEFVRDVIVAVAVLATVIALVVRSTSDYEPGHSRRDEVSVATDIPGARDPRAPEQQSGSEGPLDIPRQTTASS